MKDNVWRLPWAIGDNFSNGCDIVDCDGLVVASIVDDDDPERCVPTAEFIIRATSRDNS